MQLSDDAVSMVSSIVPVTPMLSEKITVCIFAYNEERRLAACIKNFAGLFKILIIDNFSADATRDIAASLGCRCVSIQNPGFVENSQVIDQVEQAVDTEYLLMSFTSEFVPLRLLRRYAEIANDGKYDVVKAYRFPITSGKPMQLDGMASESASQIRLTKKGAVDYSLNKIHGVGKINAPQGRVLSLAADRQYYFYTFRDYDVSRTERTHCTYNDILARQKFDSGVRFGFFRAIASSLRAFLRGYVTGRSYRFGMFGLIHSYYRFHMVLGVWFRIWELEHGYDSDSSIRRNVKARSALEEEFETQLKELRLSESQ